ncbi:MAG: uroporphyrinogen decarboxylase family protein [Anaerolineae bacterium]
MDFSAHNEEVRRMREAYDARRPYRVPVEFNLSMRYFIAEPEVNTSGITWVEFSEDPDVMFDTYMRRHRWLRHNVLADWEMGAPEQEWPGASVDFQNIYEASWLGCDWHYIDRDNPPDVWPVFKEHKEKLYDTAIPDPLHGNLMGRVLEFYEHMEHKRKSFEMDGKPVGQTGVPRGTDGLFTLACALRGATEVCLDMYEDEKYYHDLMDFVMRATRARILAWREYLGVPLKGQQLGFADDSIELLSNNTYRRLVLPYHKQFFDEFSLGGPNSIHLCGRASHHFKTLRDELNIQAFDTGFPTDLAWCRRELGPDVQLRGNIHPELLRQGPLPALKDAVVSLLQSGVMEGGRFVLCEGNNVAPHTPVENMRHMYEVGREYGRYGQ